MDTRHNVQPSVHHVQNILDEFASYDATLQACKEDLWRVIAHAVALLIPLGVTCVVASNINLGMIFTVYTMFPQLPSQTSTPVDTARFLDPIFPPRGSPTVLRPSRSATFILALWYSSFSCLLFTLIPSIIMLRKLVIYTRAKTSGETTESLRARHNDLMKWKFLEAVEFLRLFVQTGVMFLLVAGCEFTRSLSVSVGWVLTSILTVIEAVFLWHLVVSWIAAFSLSKPTTRGSLGDMDTLVQDDETLRTWMRGELMEMDGEAVISCVHHILQVRMGQVVKSFGDLGNVEKISLQGRLALLQILNDALRDEIYQWEVDKEVSWTSWIGEAVVGVDNILQSAPYAPEFKLQAEVNGELLVKLLAQDVATAKRVMFHLTSCLDPMVGQKFPLITSSPILINVLKAGQDLTKVEQVNKHNLRKIIRRIAEHGRCDLIISYAEQLRTLAHTLPESEESSSNTQTEGFPK